MSSLAPSAPLRVLIAGGGIAALETVLALRALAADRVAILLVAPNPEFTLHPPEMARAFARGHDRALPLARFAVEQEIDLVHGGALAVDAERRLLTCTDGGVRAYDELVLAIGATARPAFPRALTFGGGLDPLALGGLLADLDKGYSASVAFLIPAGPTWPLPLYDLALTAADEVSRLGLEGVALHLVTPEREPLAAFGPEASTAVAGLLDGADITLHLGVSATVDPDDGSIALGGDGLLQVDRIVALPVLGGPALTGVPADPEGFIPVDERCRVVGLDHVRAAGDATDEPVKHGGSACRMAGIVAAGIAAEAGAQVPVGPLPRHLAPYLEAHGLSDLPPRAAASSADADGGVVLGVGA